MESNRRQFLQSAAVGIAAAATRTQAATPALPTIKLGKYEVTRLIAGSNPQYGYSHFNRLYDQHMRDYHTTERVAELLKACQANGINTWQVGYQDRTGADLARFREQGGNLHWICLYNPESLENPSKLKEILSLKPIAIVQHGGLTDRIWQAGEFQKSRDFLKKIRDTGLMVGLSTHNPAVLDRVEGEGWDVDFFMTCVYYVTRPAAEAQKMLSEVPLGELYLPSDPPRMCAAIRQSKKTCLAFKILAAGRLANTPQQRKNCFEFAFRNVKPTDAVIVGMYNRFGDQVQENAEVARALLTGAGARAARSPN